LDTGFIEKHHAVIFHDSQYEVEKDLPLAALYLVLEQEADAQQRAQASNDPTSPWHATNAWRLNEAHLHRFSLKFHEQEYEVAVEQLASGSASRYAITVNGKRIHAQGNIEGNILHANLDGYQLRATVAEHDGSYSLYTQDSALTFSLIQPDLGDLDANEGAGGLTAPMNGTMVTLLVEPGSSVKKDDALLVMEAMKMEHTIRAPADGTVNAFYYQPGDLVDGGAELVDFESQ
jgi:3-methylcrotonyl-CoA carboxylase alpha subunit